MALGPESSPPLALVGPTASGKTMAAIELAGSCDRLELVSVDSMTVYRSMDVGTAKPGSDELKGVRYHLLDVADPWEEYSVSRFQSDARKAMELISSRDGLALLVGGTGLYFQAVVDGLQIPGRWPDIRAELEEAAASREGTGRLYRRLCELDPEGASKIQPYNSRRIVRALEVTLGSGIAFSQHGPGLFAGGRASVAAVGIELPRKELFTNIEKRLDSQLAAGWIDEVVRLLADERGLSRTARQALGYKEIIHYLEGSASIDETRQAILSRTKRFAKRQMAWFKRDPRIRWLDSPGRARMELVSIMSTMSGCRD